MDISYLCMISRSFCIGKQLRNENEMPLQYFPLATALLATHRVQNIDFCKLLQLQRRAKFTAYITNLWYNSQISVIWQLCFISITILQSINFGESGLVLKSYHHHIYTLFFNSHCSLTDLITSLKIFPLSENSFRTLQLLTLDVLHISNQSSIEEIPQYLSQYIRRTCEC